MFQESVIIQLIIVLSSFQTTTQETRPVQRKDSVVVSAGISKQQLALEDGLNGIISQGDQALASGNAADAIKQYASAVDLVQKQPLLAEQKDRTLKKLATGYMRGNRATDAIPIYSMLVDERKKDCESESTAVSTCAEAEYDLGLAKTYSGDFVGALVTLREAEANHARAQKFGNFHEFAMIEIMKQAQTKLLISASLFRLGRTAEAIATTEAAIPQLTSVQADRDILTGIRDAAAHSLQEAQTLLARFKSAQ
jgi:tetratricopeptide (TPR) repeat protein